MRPEQNANTRTTRESPLRQRWAVPHVDSDMGQNEIWDTFLESHPSGQFYQSSLWALVKQRHGWGVERCLLWRDGELAGGFQMLTKAVRPLGRAGFVPKGPVIPEHGKGLLELALETMMELCRRHGVQVLVVQPPDTAHWMAPGLERLGFLPDFLGCVPVTTTWVDLPDGEGSIRSRMKKSFRQSANKALRGGVTVREGTSIDLPGFYRLMLQSCKRQNVRPNPANPGFLEDLWRVFRPRGHVHLLLAEYEGRVVSGDLIIRFGRRADFWKTGWSGELARMGPNHLLQLRGLELAHTLGCKICDLGPLGRIHGKALMGAQDLLEPMKGSSGHFKVNCGGVPRLIPPAFFYFPNPALRSLYVRLIPRFSRLGQARRIIQLLLS